MFQVKVGFFSRTTSVISGELNKGRRMLGIGIWWQIFIPLWMWNGCQWLRADEQLDRFARKRWLKGGDWEEVFCYQQLPSIVRSLFSGLRSPINVSLGFRGQHRCRSVLTFLCSLKTSTLLVHPCSVAKSALAPHPQPPPLSFSFPRQEEDWFFYFSGFLLLCCRIYPQKIGNPSLKDAGEWLIFCLFSFAGNTWNCGNQEVQGQWRYIYTFYVLFLWLEYGRDRI